MAVVGGLRAQCGLAPKLSYPGKGLAARLFEMDSCYITDTSLQKFELNQPPLAPNASLHRSHR